MAGDSGVETCANPDGERRKRPLEDAGAPEAAEAKRTLLGGVGGGGEDSYHLKILVPAAAAGAIIGKGGETVAQLQKEAGVRLTMSKAQDFYPGTTERVCLMTGGVDAILSVLEFIMDRIAEKPDSRANDRDRRVKILVPNATAGMIIGKAGDYIKQIKDSSGSYVQISQKADDVTALRERCITVVGDRRQNLRACRMILAKVAEDPRSGTCLNVSYAEVNGPVANFNPTGSPFALQNAPAPSPGAVAAAAVAPTSLTGSSYEASTGGAAVLGHGLNLSVNIAAAVPPAPSPAGPMEHVVGQLRAAGFTEAQIAEICQALGVLAKYGILGLGGGQQQSASAATPRERRAKRKAQEDDDH